MRLSRLLLLATMAVPVAAQLARAQATDSMIYMVSYIDAAFAAEAQTSGLLRQLRDASRKDPGVIRFEVLQRTAPSNQFVILEIWRDQPALDAHAASAHARQFREKLAPHLIAPVDDRLCITTTVDASHAGPLDAAGAVHVVTHVDVPGPAREKALAALNVLAGRSRTDPGNLRFDVVHQKARTNHFTVIEAWRDQASANAHELAAHTRTFRDELTPMTGALYDQRWYKGL